MGFLRVASLSSLSIWTSLIQVACDRQSLQDGQHRRVLLHTAFDISAEGEASAFKEHRLARASRSSHLLSRQHQDFADQEAILPATGGATSTHYSSWSERLGNSLMTFILGIIAIIFSVPILWSGESRNAKMESLLSRAHEQMRTVDSKVADPENDSWPVHVSAARLHAAAPVQDANFDVVIKEGCIRLRSKVEVYQVVEESTTSERDTFGGGKETTTVYNYSREWSEHYEDSSKFVDISMRINWKPEGVEPGINTQDCSRVEFGEAFVLSEGLVQQCEGFVAARSLLGDAVCTIERGLRFSMEQDGFFYLRRFGASAVSGQPEIGDCRVSFEYVPEGKDVTVIALQVAIPDEQRRSFLPYRLVSRGLCGMNEDSEKEALLREGEKSTNQLAKEAGCPGFMAVICCACHLVAQCCAAIMTPEVHHLFEGNVDLQQCLDRLIGYNAAIKWVGRIVGWLLMFWGFYALFSPILTFIEVVPFVGPLVSRVGGSIIWLLCGLSTWLLTCLIVGIAFLFYHPKQAATLLIVAVLVPLSICFAANCFLVKST